MQTHAPIVAKVMAIGQAAHALRLAANAYALETTPANEQRLLAAIEQMKAAKR